MCGGVTSAAAVYEYLYRASNVLPPLTGLYFRVECYRALRGTHATRFGAVRGFLLRVCPGE